MTRQIKIALLMATSLFMDIMDGTIVTTALPVLTRVFHISSATASLLVSSYMITLAVFIPLSGWLSDRFGKKFMWLFAVSLFTVSSLGSALAPNFSILLFMRILQGLAASLMTPTARIIVLAKTKSIDLLRMTSFFIWPALIAPVLAPLLGGAILMAFSWHWIFLINVPIGILSIFIGWHLVDKDTTNVHQPFDILGFSEIALTSALVLISGELASRGVHFYATAAILLIIGIVFGLVTVHHLTINSRPIFGIQALHITSFRITQTGGAFLWLSVGALPYLLTLFLQDQFSWSPVRAGAYVLFIFLGNIGIKPFTTFIIEHLHYRTTLLASFGAVLISSVAFALVTTVTPGWVIMGLAFIAGAGRSLALTAYNGLSFSEILPEDRGNANTLSAVIQTLAQGLGISLVSVVIAVTRVFTNSSSAYAVGFIFLGLLILYPIIEVFQVSSSIGKNTLRS